MATLDQLGQWIVDNQDKKDTPEFNTVAAAYKEQRSAGQQDAPAPQAPTPEAQEPEAPGFWKQFAYGFDNNRSVSQAAIEESAKRFTISKEKMGAFLKDPGFLLPGPLGGLHAMSKILESRSPEERQRIEQESEIRKDLELASEHPTVHNNPDAQGAGTVIGGIARQFMDPTMLLGPAAGTGLKGAAAINAAIVGADSAAVQALETGEVDPRQVLLATAIGAVAGPTAKLAVSGARGAGKALAKVGKSRKSVDAVQDLVVEGGARKRAYQKVGLNEQEAAARAVRDISPRSEAVQAAGGDVTNLTREIQRGPQLGEGVAAMNTRNAITARFGAIAGTEKKLAKFDKAVTKSVSNERAKLPEGFTNVYRSAYDAMSRVSPRLANLLRRYEFDLGSTIVGRLGRKGLNLMDQATGSMTGPASKAWKKWSGKNAAAARELKLAMFNGNTPELTRLMPKLPAEVQQTLTTWRSMREEYRTAIQESGHGDLDWVKEYFPREFVDADHMKAHFLKRGVDGNIVDQSTADLQRMYRGDPDSLALEKRVDALNSLARSPEIPGGVRTGRTSQMKERQVQHIKAVDLPAMRDPFETMAKYVNDVESNLAKRRLFGVDPNNLEASIGSKMDELVPTGDLTPADAELAKRILNARFVTGERSMGKWAQHARNVTNMVLLGNPGSALVQLGDVATGMAYNGVRNTMRSMWDTMGRRNEFNQIDLGIVNVAAELNQRAAKGTGPALDWTLTHSGFRGMDKFGKTTAINGSLNKLRGWARKTPGQLEVKYKDALTPDELQTLTDALKQTRRGDMTPEQDELVRYALFNELSNMQPVSLTELPVKYLQLRNGRMMYQLKSFTLKQQELMRRQFFNKLKSNPKEAIAFGSKYLLSMGLLSGSIDFARDSLTGKYGTEPGENVEDVVLQGAENVLLSSTGFLNRFTTDKLLRGDVQGAVSDTILPPGISVTGRVAQSLIQGEPEKALRYIPMVGIFAPWGGGN